MRTIDEWIGATPDTKPPDRVYVRVFKAKNGICHRCLRIIRTGEKWFLEHLTALINGGENRESNLDVTCPWCFPLKNAEDVAEKSMVYRKSKKHLGIRKASRFACSRSSPFKKKITGEVVRR